MPPRALMTLHPAALARVPTPAPPAAALTVAGLHAWGPGRGRKITLGGGCMGQSAALEGNQARLQAQWLVRAGPRLLHVYQDA